MLRERLHRYHKWLGFTLGALITLQAVTGLSLVFKDELLIALNREMLAGARASDHPAITEALEAVGPRPAERVSLERIVYPAGARTAILLYLHADGNEARRIVASDPNTGKILGEIQGAGSIPFVLFSLHDELAIGAAGRFILLIVGTGVVFFAVTGLYLARPWRRSIRQLRWRGKKLQRRLDLHRMVGLIAAPLLLLIALTGVVLQADFLAASGTAPPKPISPARWIGAAPQLRALEERFPGAIEDVRAANDGAHVSVLLHATDVVRPLAYDRALIDLDTGNVEGVRRARDETPGRSALDWMYPVHSGKALGAVGAALNVVAGTGLLLLPTFGLLLWLSRPQRATRPARR